MCVKQIRRLCAKEKTYEWAHNDYHIRPLSYYNKVTYMLFLSSYNSNIVKMKEIISYVKKNKL